MNDFQDIYRQSMDRLPGLSIDASSVLDEVKHRKRLAKRRKQMLSSAAVTCSLLLICGAGSAAASGYLKNVIRATEHGFLSGDAVTMEQAAPAEACGIMEAAAEVPKAGTEVPEAGTGGIREDAVLRDGRTDQGAGGAEQAADNIGQDAKAAEQDQAGNRSYQEEALKLPKEEAAVLEENPFREYDSIEEFRANETAVLALPAMKQEEAESVTILVSASMEQVRFLQRMKDGRMIQVSAACYKDSEGHSTSIVYGDAVTGRSDYTTEAGFTYTVLETEGETEADYGLHAAIAVGDYEVFADFLGYTRQQALQMIESMDLSVYSVE